MFVTYQSRDYQVVIAGQPVKDPELGPQPNEDA